MFVNIDLHVFKHFFHRRKLKKKKEKKKGGGSGHESQKIPPIRIKEQAYQTLVRPLVEYASTVWNPYTKTEINKIEAYKEEQLDMPSTTRETDLVSATCSRDSNGDLWQTGEKMQD